MTPNLVPLAVAVPLLTAAALPLLSRLGLTRGALDLVGILAALVTSAIDGLLFGYASQAPVVYWFGGWVPSGGFPVGIPFLIEPIAAGATTLAAVLTLAGLVFSARPFEEYGTFFQSLLLIFLAALTGFCFAADIFNQFVFFELMGVAAYALTAYKVEATGPLQGGLNFAVLNSIGAMAILMGIGLVYGVTGSLTMAEAGRRLAARGPDLLLMAALGLCFCGYFVKGAVFPFHFWLPDAHAVAPTAASVLFSGIMVETAIIGGARSFRWLFAPALGSKEESVRAIMVVLAGCTALLGALMAPQQRHLKRLLAFSTISHAGIMTSAALLAKKGLAGVSIYLVGHGLVKGALFICAGIVLHRKGSVDELELRGRGRDLRLCGLLYFLAAIGLTGVPPFATGTGKALIEEGARQAGCHWFPWAALAATVLTSAAVLRAGIRIFLGFGPPDALTETAPASGTTEARETGGAKGRTPYSMALPAALLVALAAALGLWPKAAQVADGAASLYLKPAALEALILRGVPLALPPGEPFHLQTGQIAAPFATLGAAVLLAAGLLALPPASRRKRSGKFLLLPRALRAMHSGHVGDYAAWFSAGCGLLLLLFALLAH